MAQALAADPLPIRTALVVQAADPLVDAAVVARTEDELRRLLEDSGRYHVLSSELAEGRLGHAPQDLTLRCGSPVHPPIDHDCWTQAGLDLGVDQVVSLEVAPDWSSPKGEILIVDVAAELPLRQYRAKLPRSGGAPAEVAEPLFFAAGAMALQVPAGTRVEVDDQSIPVRDGVAEVAPLAAGKHQVRVLLPGQDRAQLAAVVVAPERTTTLVIEAPAPPVPERVRWGPWALAGLVGAGIAAIAWTATQPAEGY